MKKSILAVAAMCVLLTGCGARAIDIQATGAQPVHGAGALHYFCHGPNLIYVTIIESSTDDEYESIWPGGCAPTDLDGDPKTPNPPGVEVPWTMSFATPEWSSAPPGDSDLDNE